MTMYIMNTEQLKEAVRIGGYVFPGSYPLFFMCSNGDCLAPETVKKHYKEVYKAVKDNNRHSNWHVIACDVNWEDEDMIDAETNKPIESAYGENRKEDSTANESSTI